MIYIINIKMDQVRVYIIFWRLILNEDKTYERYFLTFQVCILVSSMSFSLWLYQWFSEWEKKYPFSMSSDLMFMSGRQASVLPPKIWWCPIMSPVALAMMLAVNWRLSSDGVGETTLEPYFTQRSTSSGWRWTLSSSVQEMNSGVRPSSAIIFAKRSNLSLSFHLVRGNHLHHSTDDSRLSNDEISPATDFIRNDDVCRNCNRGELVPHEEEGILICNNRGGWKNLGGCSTDNGH